MYLLLSLMFTLTFSVADIRSLDTKTESKKSEHIERKDIQACVNVAIGPFKECDTKFHQLNAENHRRYLEILTSFIKSVKDCAGENTQECFEKGKAQDKLAYDKFSQNDIIFIENIRKLKKSCDVDFHKNHECDNIASMLGLN